MTMTTNTTPEAAIIDGLAEARLMIAYARGRIALGRLVDLLPIEKAVDELCAAVAALGAPRSRPFMDRLTLLDDDLASLADELATQDASSGAPPRSAPAVTSDAAAGCRP